MSKNLNKVDKIKKTPKKRRKKSSGKYAVPAEVRALKPKDIACIVKYINGHYYVYEYSKKEDPKNPGKKKNVSGACIGKIEGGEYIPNSSKDNNIKTPLKSINI